MGLTAKSTGFSAAGGDITVRKNSPDDKIIAFAGNPNVGKSTVFNALTGLHQHTGNWSGKTVATAQGHFKSKRFSYIPVDIPGTYSLLAHSAEEEVARDFICFGGADAAVVVCDATCPERSLNLALQIMEVCPKTLVCMNLMDEAERRGIKPNIPLLEKELGVPVVGTSAHDKKTLSALVEKLDRLCAGEIVPEPRKLHYIKPIEGALDILAPAVEKFTGNVLPPRWTALRLLDNETSFTAGIEEFLGVKFSENEEIAKALEQAQNLLAENDITADCLKDRIVSCIMLNAEEACGDAFSAVPRTLSRADKILTSRVWGFPIMFLLLILVFWITIIGANYPSECLSKLLFGLGDKLSELMININAPEWLRGILVDGAYRVLAWVVAVMLPPMAIFFPLFSLLEDLGYLPRIAYNLDRPFCKCNACGKQALTMCMV